MVLPTDISSTEAIERTAWDKAVDLRRRWEEKSKLAEGGPGGMGHIDPWAAGLRNILRTQLDEMVALYGWQQTYVDPMTPDWPRTCYLSPLWPPVKLGEARAKADAIEDADEPADGLDPMAARDRAADEAEFGR